MLINKVSERLEELCSNAGALAIEKVQILVQNFQEKRPLLVFPVLDNLDRALQTRQDALVVSVAGAVISAGPEEVGAVVNCTALVHLVQQLCAVLSGLGHQRVIVVRCEDSDVLKRCDKEGDGAKLRLAVGNLLFVANESLDSKLVSNCLVIAIRCNLSRLI